MSQGGGLGQGAGGGGDIMAALERMMAPIMGGRGITTGPLGQPAPTLQSPAPRETPGDRALPRATPVGAPVGGIPVGSPGQAPAQPPATAPAPVALPAAGQQARGLGAGTSPRRTLPPWTRQQARR